MATRRETQLKRLEMRDGLLASLRDGSLSPGDVIPPLRELALKHKLSLTLASQVVKELVEEGVLQTTQGAGTFVSRAHSEGTALYLLVLSDGYQENREQMLPMKLGFEERVTQFGGTCLTLTPLQIRQFLGQEHRLRIEGIFNQVGENVSPALEELYPSVPQVFFGEATGAPRSGPHDWVYFDNEQGAYEATNHLIEMRHRQIAYLGLHGDGNENPTFHWSYQRQNGWQRALSEKQLDNRSFAFHPALSGGTSIKSQIASARQTAVQMLPLIEMRQITAVLAVNCHAARGLFEALHESKVPYEVWPSVVCVGSAESTGEAPVVVSEMRLPWESVGREAANLLWSRRTYAGAPRTTRVPMRLISRLSCKANWPLLPQAISLALQAA